MKKQIASLVLGLIAITFTTASFAAVKNTNISSPFFISWEKAKAINNASADVSIIYSQADGHAITTAFDKKGNWIYTVKHYTSDNLAKNIMDIINVRFGNFYITSMEEVNQPAFDKVFLVHAEDAATIKTFRVVNGEAELVQDFVKG